MLLGARVIKYYILTLENEVIFEKVDCHVIPLEIFINHLRNLFFLLKYLLKLNLGNIMNFTV